MPKAERYTEKRFVMLTPVQARQLERLSEDHGVSVPESILTALCQHDGVPTESDRMPGLCDAKRRAQGS